MTDPRRILIVEDERIAAEDMKRRLESWGYEVQGIVGSGEEAIRSVAELKPDLLLMDIHLRGSVDGVEAARTIGMKSDIPVVYATAFTDTATLARAKSTNPRGFISKPYDDREMRSVIERAFRSQQADGSRGPRPFHTLRILVADDGEVNQLVVRSMLERIGCKVDVVCNGAEAVRALGAVHYDLVFMDCQMPVLDGFEATSRIRTLQGLDPRVPIIAMTANDLDSDRGKCTAAGMDDFLPKPVRLDSLRTVIRKWA